MQEPNAKVWQGKQVFVTGAGGFIGSHLVESLVRHGAKVTALHKYNGAGSWGLLESLPKETLNEVDVVLGDVSDSFAMQKMLTPRLDVVFHLAALIGIPYSYQAPQQYVQTNIQGTLNVLEACLRSGIGRLVQTSTSEVYGTAQYAPIDENHPLQGQSPYSATKIAADKLAESYFCSFQLPVTVLRPFNTFGPRQSARAFIPSMISQALSADELHVGDLTPCRDLLYVSDTVAGFMAAALSPHTVGQTVHIGTGQTHAMSDVLQTILNLLGKPNLAVITDTARLRPDGSEVRLLQCNPQRAKTWMHWQAEVSLEEGLQHTIEAVRDSLTAYKPLLYAR